MKIFKVFNPFRVFFIALFLILLILGGFLAYMFSGQAEPAENIEYGITFSQYFAEKFEFDWKRAYKFMLDDLEVKKLRLVAYWPMIEEQKGEFDFVDLDWQIEQATEKEAEVILVVGQKVPRWPECHIPDWVKEMSPEEQKERLLNFIEKTVVHYRDNSTIKIWQVENEPFLKGFGECPKLDKDLLEKEISLVRHLDYNFRPIMLTASGELSSWTEPASRADLLGTTLYRIIWNENIGYFEYPIPPVFYHKRAQLVKKITGIDRILICELQLEPWSSKQIYETNEREQARSMDLKRFKEVIAYSKRTGFDEMYLWGVEWWYQRSIDGNNALWNEAKKLFID